MHIKMYLSNPRSGLISVLNGKESIMCMSDWSSVAGLQPVFLIHFPKPYDGLLAIIYGALSKKISNDQELIQSDPTSCPQNQKGNN